MKKKHYLANIISLLVIIILVGVGWYFLKVNNINLIEYFNIANIDNVVKMQNMDEIKNAIIVTISEENIETSKTETIPPIGNNITNPSKVKTYCYFYEQLDEYGKILYKGLEENVENMKKGNYTIDFGEKFGNLLSHSGGDSILKQAYQDAWDAFYSDRVDVFYLDSSKMYLYISTLKTLFKTTYTVTIGPEEKGNYYKEGYSSKEQVNKALKEIEEVKNSVKLQLTGDNFNKVKQVNDCLVVSLAYDETMQRANTRNLYGGLVERQVVCEGYAKAFKYLMDDLEIPCVLVSGTGTNSNGETEAHLWNYVQLEGNWYAVDVTWNDPVIQGIGKTTTQMMRRFLAKGSEKFNQNHAEIGRISEEGKIFNYPELSKEDYK